MRPRARNGDDVGNGSTLRERWLRGIVIQHNRVHSVPFHREGRKLAVELLAQRKLGAKSTSCGCTCPKSNLCLDEDVTACCDDIVTGTALVVEMKQANSTTRNTVAVYCGGCQVWVECDCPEEEAHG